MNKRKHSSILQAGARTLRRLSSRHQSKPFISALIAIESKKNNNSRKQSKSFFEMLFCCIVRKII